MNQNHTQPEESHAPRAPRIPFQHQYHDESIDDPYHWMCNRDDPRVREYLEAENTYTEATLAHVKAFEHRLFEEMKGRIQETDRTAPYPYGRWAYYSRTLEGAEYRIHCRMPRAALDPDVVADNREGSPFPGEEILLDVNRLAEGKSYLSLGGSAIDDPP